MSETAQPENQEFERFHAALKQILTVSKPEILRREAEAKEQRKALRKERARGENQQ